MISLDVIEAVGILDSIGCDQDPVTWKGGIESSPTEIALETFSNIKASKIRICYWNYHHDLVKGSLYSMVRDRLGLQKYVRKRRVPQNKTYRLFDWRGGVVHFEIIKQIESDTRIRFTFPSDAFEDYQILIEVIASQLRDERFKCTTSSDNDIDITIQF